MNPENLKSKAPDGSIQRRSFLKASVGGASTLAFGGLIGSSTKVSAVEPFHRTGSPRLKTSLAAYSFRNQLQSSNPKEKIDLFRFMDYCVEQDCDAAELTSYYFESTETEYLLRLKRHAFLLGLDISGTAVGNNFSLPLGSDRDKQISDVKAWIERAALLGVPHIRIFAGPKGSLEFNEAKKLCVDGIQECADHAAQFGVFLGLENHGGIVARAEDLVDIVQQVNSPWVGVNLDTGNFHTLDPYADLDICTPWAVNVQLKVEVRAQGSTSKETDYARIACILNKHKYQGYVALEYESDTNPWESVPVYLEKMRKNF
jgi:sugar phosphate isomerase/epimerase